MLRFFRQLHLVYQTVLGGFYYKSFQIVVIAFVNLVSIPELVRFSHHSVPFDLLIQLINFCSEKIKF